MAEEEHNEDIKAYQWASFVGIFFQALLFALLPLQWEKFRTSKTILSIANAFSGGLFLSAAIVHIMPETTHAFEVEEGEDESFPWPFFAAVCSYSLILFIDKVLFDTHSNNVFGHGHGGPNEPHHDLDPKTQTETPKVEVVGNLEVENLEIENKEDFAAKLFSRIMENQTENKVINISMMTMAKKELNEDIVIGDYEEGLCKDDLKTSQVNIELKALKNVSQRQLVVQSRIVLQSIVDPNVQNADLSDKEIPKKETKKVKCVMAPYIMCAAIGIHAIFAGLSLGLEEEKGGFLGMLLAVLLHKWAEAMTLGISQSKHMEELGKLQTYLLVLMFCCFTPMGISIGVAISSSDAKTSAVFHGLSAGTFLYISTSEIIVEEFNSRKARFWKFLAYLCGFGIMCSVFYIERAWGNHDEH